MHSNKHTAIRSGERGFTLVELSIVLVIIGLIVGGVLVGQDLIKASEIRATVAQIEKYNSAVNTFRSRFGGIPGDLRTATDYTGVLNIGGIAGAGGTGLGDGNGILTQAASATAITNATGETTLFWRHLSEASLIDGNFNDDVVAGGTFATLGTSFPRAKIDRGGIGVYGAAGYNYFQIGQTTSTADAAVYAHMLTPNEAFNIDNKIDDGLPLTGQTIVRGSGAPNAAQVAADVNDTTGCTMSTASTNRWTLANTGVACELRLRMN